MKKLGWGLYLIVGLLIVCWGSDTYAVTEDSNIQNSSNVPADTTDSNPVLFKKEDQKIYGTAPWTWDSETQTITFGGGEFPESNKESNIKTVIEDDPMLEGKKIRKIKVTEPSTLNENSSWLFSGLYELETIENSSLLSMSNVVNASYMFFNIVGSETTSLKQLDVSTWDTSNITDMSGIFSNAMLLEQLDVSNWETSNVTDMSGIFNNASSLKQLDVASWDTSNVTSMESLFNGAKNLTNLDVSNWNTSKVVNMNEVFEGLSNLRSLDVSNWNTSNVEEMVGLFNGLKNVENLDVSKWDTSNVTNMLGTFLNTGVSKLDVSNWNTSKVMYFTQMFCESDNLKSLDVSNFDLSSLKGEGLSWMFYKAANIENLDVSEWDTSRATELKHVFDGMSNLTNLDVSKWDVSNVKVMDGLFSGTSITSLDLSSWDMKNLYPYEWATAIMFTEMNALDTLVLGENNKFYPNTELPEKKDDLYTGAWMLESGGNKYLSSEEFLTSYDGSKSGKYIREKVIGVTGIQLLPTDTSIKIGEEKQLETQILPVDATNKVVHFVSNNSKVATVSEDGKVAGMSEGSAIITATTEDGEFQAMSTITVKPKSQIRLNEFYLGIDDYVSGEVPVSLGAKKAQLLINGVLVSTSNVSSTGSLELATNGMIISEKDQVEVQVLDRKKVVLDQKEVNIVLKNYELTVNPFVLYTGVCLSGKTDMFHTEVSLIVNGEEIERKFLTPEHEFSFDTTDVIEYEDDEVEIVGYRYGVEITRVPVMIQSPIIDVTVPPYKIGSGYVTGKVIGDGAKNVRLYINHRRQVEDTLSTDGTFKLTGFLIMSPLDKVEIGIYNEAGIELKRVLVSVIY